MSENHKRIYEAILIVSKQLEPIYGKTSETDEIITNRIDTLLQDAVDGVSNFMLGNGLFGAPNIFIGKCTPSCQYAKKPGPGRDTTWEHIWGRKNSAITIIQQIRKGKSDKFLTALIKSRCRVTITLKSENQALRPYQNDEVLAKKHPRVAYKAAGLEWVDYIGDKVYNIEGVVYNSREDIMLHHDVTPQQLSYRLGKASKKWKDWYIERVT